MTVVAVVVVMLAVVVVVVAVVTVVIVVVAVVTVVVVVVVIVTPVVAVMTPVVAVMTPVVAVVAVMTANALADENKTYDEANGQQNVQKDNASCRLRRAKHHGSWNENLVIVFLLALLVSLSQARKLAQNLLEFRSGFRGELCCDGREAE
eukprot:CAMPEP_0185571334 /NCGR_PEP_ID=MMETSP0434-20130131/3398_1 /TAXON_ID=626734 ORGANISM="Favella taraikaensis, Strain Fe Narragansett Bay" /NCGR_SAMPLE_ID=MMETSP0434 /ASSEMBLY_ACC=CAM_ASM_000379 /LENGTH=149 /DNA_ID=CAMNT_0028186721 /DNA_START=331 /DNA_END=780 /DNA_ORIENTATION=+